MIKAEFLPRQSDKYIERASGLGVQITFYHNDYQAQAITLDWQDAEDLFHELDRLLTQRVNSIATQAADIPSSPEAENTE